MQGRDLRLVRVGAAEIALQFEFFNGTDEEITPDKLGIDQVELSLMLVDLPRSTAYRVLDTRRARRAAQREQRRHGAAGRQRSR